MAPDLPRAIGRYEVVDRVGRGGMGVVFRARDPRIGRNVAIKLLSVPDESLRERFLQEAQSVGSLAHRNIVTIFDYGEHEGQSYIVMEFVEGVTLAEQIHDNVPIPLWRKLEIVEELSSGLDYAHNKGIVHRDIKPANVMTDREGVVKILDFGIARVGNITMTQAGMMLGTPNYMSPEQFESGRVDRRSDIFSVGVLFYELLAYRKAFTGQQVWDVMKSVVSKSPTPLSEIIPGLDREVEAAVMRAIEKDPAKRYQTLAEMHDDLAKVKARLAVKLASPLSITALTPTGEEARAPKPNTDRALQISKRRAERIEEYLKEATRAFDAGEFGTAVDACDQALLLDADDSRILGMLERARQALDHQQAVELMAEARACMERGEIDNAAAAINQATSLDPSFVEAADVKATIDERLREREAEVRRHEQELQSAKAIVLQARREFDAGKWQKAMGMLDRHTPQHELVLEALAEMRSELEEIERRAREEQEEREREQAEAQRRWVARQLDLAKRALASSHFGEALEILDHVQRNSQNPQGLAELLRQARQGKSAAEELERRTRDIADILEKAANEFAQGRLIDARSLVASALTMDPAHPEALARLREIKAAIEADEKKKALDRDAERAVVEARRRFDIGEHASALKMLQSFSPPHPATTHAFDELKKVLAEIDQQKEDAAKKRAAERKQREEQAAAAAAQAQRDREATKLVTDAKKKMEADDLAAATQLIQQALAIDPANRDAADATVTLNTMLVRKKASETRVTEPPPAVVEPPSAKATAIKPAPVVSPPPAPPAPPTVLVEPPRAPVQAEKPSQDATKPAGVPVIKPSPPPPVAERVSGGLAGPAPDISYQPSRPAPAPVPAPTPAPARVPAPAPARDTAPQNLVAQLQPYATPRNLGIAGAALVVLLAIVYFATRTPSPAPTNTTAQTSAPTPAAPPATVPSNTPVSAPPATPAPTAAPTPPTPSIDQQLAEIRDRARQQFGRGDWQSGLTTAASGLNLRKDDPDLQLILNDGLSAARTAVTTARDATTALGKSAVGTDAFKQAVRRSQTSDQQQARGQTPAAIRTAWEAVDLFKKAREEGQRADAAPKGPVNAPTPAPVSPPTPPVVSQPPPVSTQQPPATVPAPPVTNPAPAPGPSTTPPVSRPPAQVVSEEPAIRAMLNAYAQAYSDLDPDAVRRYYPSINQDVLKRGFKDLKSQRVQIQDPQILVTGATATVSCTIVTAASPRVGSPRTDSRAALLRLEKRGDNWVILQRQ